MAKAIENMLNQCEIDEKDESYSQTIYQYYRLFGKDIDLNVVHAFEDIDIVVGTNGIKLIGNTIRQINHLNGETSYYPSCFDYINVFKVVDTSELKNERKLTQKDAVDALIELFELHYGDDIRIFDTKILEYMTLCFGFYNNIQTHLRVPNMEDIVMFITNDMAT